MNKNNHNRTKNLKEIHSKNVFIDDLKNRKDDLSVRLTHYLQKNFNVDFMNRKNEY